MADRSYDKPEERTLRGKARRAFGPEFRDGAADGAVRALTLGHKDRPDVWASIPVMGAMAIGLSVPLFYHQNVDVTVAADAAIMRGEASMVALSEGPNTYRYVLHLGPQGYEVYRGGDYSERDDRLALLTDPAEALNAAMRVVRVFAAVDEATQGNLRAMPETMPSFMRYERISPLFAQAGETGDYYRVGDNVTVEADRLSPADVRANLVLWREAAVRIAGGAYTPPQSSVQGDHLHAGNLVAPALLSVIGAYGGLAGAGALAGGIGAVRRRRKDGGKHGR